MLSAWGSTETAPSSTQIHFLMERAGVIGVPGAGTEIKLAASSGGDGKLELRVKGPERDARLLAAAASSTAGLFDADGFLKTGDAGKLADPRDPNRGILFDGRLAENFKLTSGTWVHVGELRLEVIAAGAPVVQDVVVTGHDREELGLLVFPNPAGCRSLCGGVAETEPLAELIAGRRCALTSPPPSPPTTPRTPPTAGASPAPCCSPSRRRSRPARSPTRGTSISAPCWRGATALVERLYEGGPGGERIVIPA